MPLKDRNQARPGRLPRKGIIRLGYRVISCRNQDCKTDAGRRSTMRVSHNPASVTCETCGTVHRRPQKGWSTPPAYPTEADHFVLHDAPEVAAVYGAEPTELDVLLPFPDIERNFDANYAVWAGGLLICRGDGELVNFAAPHRVETKVNSRTKKETIHVYNESGSTLVSDGVAQIAFTWNGSHFEPGDHVPCPGAAADLYPHCAACKINAILKVLMAKPELFDLAYYQVVTGSGRNYDKLRGMLEAIPAPKLSGIPFKLTRVQEQTAYTDAAGRRRPVDKWFIEIKPDPEFMRALYEKQAARMVGMDPTPPVPESHQIEGPAEELPEGHRPFDSYCPRCGEELMPFDTICPSCGHELEEAEPEEAAGDEPAEEIDADIVVLDDLTVPEFFDVLRLEFRLKGKRVYNGWKNDQLLTVLKSETKMEDPFKLLNAHLYTVMVKYAEKKLGNGNE